ncbi:helix-turn-helix domain-containing protein [Nocardioides marinquilinus]|uniref:Helix-turn-helix domain-containing protein n=1 Tax=Nocardioides marinquilinus TaxID=1210400 RepID=A0ABP9P821_9ACTN
MDGSGAFDVVGLDERAEAIYRLVLAEGTVTPDAVATALPVAADEAQPELERLREAGLINRVSGRDHYSAVDPRVALRALTERTADRLDRVRADIPALALLFERLAAESGADPEVRVVDEPSLIGMWYVRLEHEVASEFLTFDRPPYVLAEENPVEPLVLARGVDWRVVYAAEGLERPGAWGELRHAVSVGERARIAPSLPTKLAIADRRKAIVATSLDLDRPVALVTEAPPLVDLLVELFESTWERSVEVPAVDDLAAAPRAGGPGADDLALLAMLDVGAKDDVIARELGMSPRTLRRRTADLLDRLGAANRFQAGAQAVRRGWI